MNASELFPDSYETSRQSFRSQLAGITARWPQARLLSRAVGGDPSLTTDWIEAPPIRATERLLLVTIGEHGVEGIISSGVLRLIVEEFTPRLDPGGVGLLLVHAINPWGMRHLRRTNAANVDLNRNFVDAEADLDPSFNPAYVHLDPFLNPPGPLPAPLPAGLAFLAGLAGGLSRMGPRTFQAVTLQGQYRNPRGLNYGGATIQPETQLLIDLLHQAPAAYDHVLQLDIHTGYGPRHQMTLVNSPLEPSSSAELARRFGYPRLAKATLDEFYPICGDMIDYVYRVFRREFPRKAVYATSFEFGTLGDSLAAQLRSLRAMIWENQIHHFGAADARLRASVQRTFLELFAPADAAWRRKALADARQAVEGVLRAEGFLSA